MMAIFLVAIAANTLFPNPVTLVQWVGAVSLAVAPLLYGLNWYCVNRLIDDPALRPPPYLAIWGGAGVLLMLAAVIAVFWIRAS
jgi:hypothetical protein